VFVFATGAGVLFAYTCGTFLSYTTLPFIYIPISLLFLIGTTFFPESAHYLVKKKRNDVIEEKFRKKVSFVLGEGI
jgi:Sugar (and other) transporter